MNSEDPNYLIEDFLCTRLIRADPRFDRPFLVLIPRSAGEMNSQQASVPEVTIGGVCKGMPNVTQIVN